LHRIARIVLIGAVAVLVCYGISMLYSTSYAGWGEQLLKRQVLWMGLGGLCAVAVASLLDYRRVGHYSWWLLGACALPLFYLACANLLFRVGPLRALALNLPFVAGLSKGSARWLRLGPVTVQPSEFAKLAILIFMANYLPRHGRHMSQIWRGFLKPVGTAGIVTGLILLGGDLSSTVIAGCAVFGLAFMGGVRMRYLLPVCIVGILLAGTAIVISPERLSRLTSYRNPELYQDADGYQLWTSQLALGSGGVGGLGFTKSRMKRFYLPEAHTDFIVAIIGEELGLIGTFLLVALYAALVVAAFALGIFAPDREGQFLCWAVALSFGLHAFVNLAVVTGLGPTTGVTAPFISYGGSNVIASMLGLGLLLSVSRIAEQERGRSEADTRSQATHRHAMRHRSNGPAPKA